MRKNYESVRRNHVKKNKKSKAKRAAPGGENQTSLSKATYIRKYVMWCPT